MDFFRRNRWVFVLLIGLIIIYLAGVIIFQQIIFPNTTINGVDFSYEPISRLFEPIEVADQVVVRGKNNERLTVNSEDINYEVNPIGTEALAQDPWKWP